MPDAVDLHFKDRGESPEFLMEMRWIDRHLPASARSVLDLGCGNGSLFPLIGRDGLVGLDYLLAGLAITRRRFPDTPLVCADASRLPLGDGLFDAVVSQHVIEHIPDHAAAIREVARVLRPGGVMIMLTPNDLFIDPGVFEDPTHLKIFKPRELAAAAEQAGLRTIDLRTRGLPAFRGPSAIPGLWRARASLVRHADTIANLPLARWRGQTLCLAARKP